MSLGYEDIGTRKSENAAKTQARKQFYMMVIDPKRSFFDNYWFSMNNKRMTEL